eukprot:SAG11_NODE_716_length_7614_cov_63.924837_12_plen_87_part_00
MCLFQHSAVKPMGVSGGWVWVSAQGGVLRFTMSFQTMKDKCEPDYAVRGPDYSAQIRAPAPLWPFWLLCQSPPTRASLQFARRVCK